MGASMLWQSFKQWRVQDRNDLLEEKATFLSDDEPASVKEKIHKRKVKSLRLWAVINLFMMGVSILTACLSFYTGKSRTRGSAVRETSFYC